jgi:hypothetical protein
MLRSKVVHAFISEYYFARIIGSSSTNTMSPNWHETHADLIIFEAHCPERL